MFLLAAWFTKVGGGRYNMSPGGGNENNSCYRKISNGEVSIRKHLELKVFLVQQEQLEEKQVL
jgi:hypothetical protein